MFMFGNTVEIVNSLRKLVDDYKSDINALESMIKSKDHALANKDKALKDLENTIDILKSKHSLELDKVRHETAKKCQELLVTSDLKRVEAEAMLKAYKDMDTKSERQHINKMLERAIDGLSLRQSVVEKK